MVNRTRIEDTDKEENKKAFHQTEDEDEKELGDNTLYIKPPLEELRQIEDERSGKGVEAETISRKEVHEKSHEEG
jgi:hypothetical protein